MSELRAHHELKLAADYPADRNPALVYLGGLRSPHSRRNMARYLDQVAAILTNRRLDASQIQWDRLRFQHISFVVSRMSEDYAPSTVNGILSAIRGVMKTAWKLGQISSEDYQRAVDIPNLKATRLPTGRDMAFREIRALIDACIADAKRNPAKAIRDIAIIGVLYATGMRRAETANLKLSHYRSASGQIVIRGGKGDKDRTVYIKNRPQSLLDQWVTLRGSRPGWLFNPVNKSGHIFQRGITDQAIYNMLKVRGQAAGIEDFSPHDLRRTFVGDALDAGIDLVTVAEIAGHASTETTRKYDRRGERTKEQAASRFDL